MLLFREFIILLSGERGREGNYNNIKYSDISSNTAADFPGLTFNPPLQHRIKNKSFPLSREISKERDWLNISNKHVKISFSISYLARLRELTMANQGRETGCLLLNYMEDLHTCILYNVYMNVVIVICLVFELRLRLAYPLASQFLTDWNFLLCQGCGESGRQVSLTDRHKVSKSDEILRVLRHCWRGQDNFQ